MLTHRSPHGHVRRHRRPAALSPSRFAWAQRRTLTRFSSEGSEGLPREPLAGTTVQTLPGTLGHLPAWFPQFRCMNRPGELGVIRTVFRLTSEKPVVRTHLRPPEKTRSGRILVLVRPIPGISAGTTGACSGWERGPAGGRAASSSISRAPCTDSRYHRHCRGLHGGEPDGCRGVQELGRPAWPNGRRPDRIGRAPAQYLPTALARSWTPLGAKHIRRAFQDVCESTRLGRDRAPRDLRHVRLAVVCQWEAVEKIARPAGHADSHVT
jgi:hypothetical protein